MAITIKQTRATSELTPVEKYLMTVAPTDTVKNIPDGTVLKVAAFMLYDDIKDDGKVAELMSILTTDNKAYVTQSVTFKRSLEDIYTVMGAFPFPVKKISGVTKAGRNFVNAVLAVEEL